MNVFPFLLLLLSYISVSICVAVTPFTSWHPYTTPLFIPPVVDCRNGQNIELVLRQFNHTFGGGMNLPTPMYGIAISTDSPPTYPGPTILTRSHVPFSITWVNKLEAPHILHDQIEPSLVTNKKLYCYPDCGIPTVTHTVGLKVAAKNDGTPLRPIGFDESVTYSIGNSQDGGTLFYHDQFAGMTRLNVYAGLIGAYTIQDQTEAGLNVLPSCDIPIMIQDKQVGIDGSLLYPGMTQSDACPAKLGTKWVPGAFGNVNTVNGIACPYVSVPRAQCRLRFINLSGSRMFQLNLVGFYSKCTMISKGSNRLAAPVQMTLRYNFYPLSRFDLICDFSNFTNGAVFNVTNSDTTFPLSANGNPAPVMQFRVFSPTVTTPKTIPAQLNDIMNLRTLWSITKGLTRNMSLVQERDNTGCSTIFGIVSDTNVNNNAVGLIPTLNSKFQCVLGTVEKWKFTNPTQQTQTVGFRIGLAQCGNDEFSNAVTELRESAQVPSSYPLTGVVTYVCYIACTPLEYLKRSTHNITDPATFPFYTQDPYLLQSNNLERQDNHMIAWLYLVSSSGSTVTATQTQELNNAQEGLTSSAFETFYAPQRVLITLVLFGVVMLVLFLFVTK